MQTLGAHLIAIAAWVFLLGGTAATALGVLGISDVARHHHVAMLAGGIPTMTIGALMLWLQRYGFK